MVLVLVYVLVAVVTLRGRVRDLRRAHRGPRPSPRSPALEAGIGGFLAVGMTALSVGGRPHLALVLLPLGLLALACLVAAPVLWNRDLAERAGDPWTVLRLSKSGVGAEACFTAGMAALLLMLLLTTYISAGISVLLLLVTIGLRDLLAEWWVRRRPEPARDPA